MKKLLDILTEQFAAVMTECGYDEKFARVTVSNRPDLCEYQCNGAMALAKAHKKAPIMIAQEIVAKLEGNEMFSEIVAVAPGFINMKISESFLASYVDEMAVSDKSGCDVNENPKKVVIDYGGPNVAKPLHVGHLRSAIIGETLKRLYRFKGDEVIGDVHLGDWGLQMGLIIEQLRIEQPDLVYFDESYEGEYPSEAPFTLSELEKIYPTASARSKVDEEFKEKAHTSTLELQKGKPGYTALWKHILNVSIPDLKQNYKNLNVDFDLWKGESDAKPYIPAMVDEMINSGLAHESQGAMVVDVTEETDTKEIPPCIIRKSDGAALYATSDLATIVQRVQDFNPDEIIYLADKRQEMHFTQVFRTAKKAGIVDDSIKLTYEGFGTMNGKDNKPFKTRDGGVMRLETLIKDVEDAVYAKIMENREESEETARATAKIVGLAAVKYGDLSNQTSKDYIFDTERFASFEGNTGPYILYTIVRIKSILEKYVAANGAIENITSGVNQSQTPSEKALMMELSKFNATIDSAYEELAPYKICAYIYDLSNAFNTFYHDNKIMGEEDKAKQAGFIKLLIVTKKTLEMAIDILGFTAPDRM